MRTLTTLLGNSQKLDGGAMFGNAPRALWSRWMQPDAENRIDLGCRALLVRDGERNVLVETGIGAFFPLLVSLVGLLWAGGLLAAWEEGQPARLLFPNAHFVSGRRHWQRARQPHPRDRASFVPELLDLLQASGRLELLDDGERSAHLGEGWRFHFSEGHTPGQMLPEIAMPDGPVVFSGDLIPGAPWVHLPLTMGYDRFPEGLIEEKERLLDSLIARNGRLVFTHDPCVAMGRVRRDEQERYSLYDTLERVENLEA